MSLAVALLVSGIPARAQDAGTLRERHAALRAALAENAFGRPLHVESSHHAGNHRGGIYAVLQHPFERVAAALRSAAQWCGVLIVQANVKNCEAPGGAGTLSLFVARRPADEPERAHRIDFSYRVPAAAADYLHVTLDSPEGPFGTTDYRIRFEAVPVEPGRTFLHLGYAYALHGAARMGMKVYLASSGRDKVGFSIVDRTSDGGPVYVGGVRGVVERNTMRYYLALEAYLDTLDVPVARRMEERLRAFHAGLERYPRQLHELELAEYLNIKLADASRVFKSAIN